MRLSGRLRGTRRRFDQQLKSIADTGNTKSLRSSVGEMTQYFELTLFSQIAAS